MQDKRFALLIDGDNISSDYIKCILNELQTQGTITYKRIYGDWTQPNLNKWKQILLEYSITPIQQYAYTVGKNATDSAMIIDAMDILYTGKVDGFCLASSDSDFTRLAARLREAGMTVIGMGKKQTPRAFVNSCSSFTYIDHDEDTEDNSSLTPEEEIKESVRKIIDDIDDEEGWAFSGDIGNLLKKAYPEFDPRNYGKRKLVLLLESWGFEVKRIPDPNSPPESNVFTVYIRYQNPSQR